MNWAEQPIIKRFSGEFADYDLESSFREGSQTATARHLSMSMIAVAALMLMFGISDFNFLGLSDNFYQLMGMRTVVALACLTLVFALHLRPELAWSPFPVNLVTFITVTGILMIVPLRPETLGTQIPAVVVASMALYLFIPNRLPWICAFNAYLAIGFLLASLQWASLSVTGFVTTALLLVLVNVTGYLASRRINRLQREQFSLLLDERAINRQLMYESNQRKLLEEQLRHMAQTDELTGLHNRRHFLELTSREMQHSLRRNKPLALCMIDVDNFKSINDQYGHAAGDTVLKEIARLCQKDLRGTDILARFGGEEFVLALPGASPERALEVTERLRSRVEEFQFEGSMAFLKLTITAGIAELERGEDSLDPALSRADRALYQGKKQGKNSVILAKASKPIRRLAPVTRLAVHGK